MRELMEKNSNIIYIDTDSIYYTGEIDLLDIELKYEIEKLCYFFIFAKKKIIRFYNNGEFKIKGFSSKHKYYDIDGIRYNTDDIVTKMKARNKARNRDNKIDEILN